MHGIHSSDPIFENPSEFRPERYLADDGVTIRKELVERTIPFGYGKRACAGEGLARMELFFAVLTTLQNYRIEPIAPIDLEPIHASVLLPKPQKLRLVKV